jgi:hypothetical protein
VRVSLGTDELITSSFYFQTFILSKTGELRRESECASVGSGHSVQMIQCEHLRKEDRWELRESSGQIYNIRARKCLTVSKDGGETHKAILDSCREADKTQRWTFDPHKGQVDSDTDN